MRGPAAAAGLAGLGVALGACEGFVALAPGACIVLVALALGGCVAAGLLGAGVLGAVPGLARVAALLWVATG